MLQITTPEDLVPLQELINANQENIVVHANIIGTLNTSLASLQAQVSSLQTQLEECCNNNNPDPDPPSEGYVFPTLPAADARPYFSIPSVEEMTARIDAVSAMTSIQQIAARTGMGELDRIRRFTSRIVLNAVDGSYAWPDVNDIISYPSEYNHFRLIYQAVTLVCMDLDKRIAEGLASGQTLAQISADNQNIIDWLVLQTNSDNVIWGRNGFTGTLLILIGLTLRGVYDLADDITQYGWGLMTDPAGVEGIPGRMCVNLPALDYYFPDGGHFEGNGYFSSMVSEMAAYDLWEQATGQSLRTICKNFKNQNNHIVYMRSEGRNIPISRYWESQLTDNENECRAWAASMNLIETDPVMSANLCKHVHDSGPLGDFARFDPAWYFVLFGSVVPLDPAAQPALNESHEFANGTVVRRNGSWVSVSAQDVHSGHRCVHQCAFALMNGPDIIISGSRTEQVRHNYWSNNANNLQIAGWPWSGPYLLDSNDNIVKANSLYNIPNADSYLVGLKVIPPLHATPGESHWDGTVHRMLEYQMEMERTVDYSDPTKIVITDVTQNPSADRRMFVQYCGEQMPEFDGTGWIMKSRDGLKSVRLVFDPSVEVTARVGFGKPNEPDQTPNMPSDYIWPLEPSEIRGGWWQLNATSTTGTVVTEIQLL